MAERSVFDEPNKESIVSKVFKGAAGGAASTALGLGTASVDGITLMKKMFIEGKSISDALKEATATRDTFKGLNEMTGLPFTREQARDQLGLGAAGAFEIGSALAPTKAPTKIGAIGRTVGNTGMNLGIESVGDMAGEGTAMALALVPGFSTRTAREALAAKYAQSLSPQQIERIKNGTITLAEITNDPAMMATQRRLQSDPATAGRFQEFDRNAANTIEQRLQSATPRAANNTPSGIVSSLYKAYEKQTESLKTAKDKLSTRDFDRVKQNIDPDAKIIDAQPIVDRIDKEIEENLALRQTDDVKATVSGLQRLREQFFDLGDPVPPELIQERMNLLEARRAELEVLQKEKPTTQRSLQINTIDRQMEQLATQGERPATLRQLSVNEIQAQLSQWSGKMYSGDGLFEGVAPNQAKRIARNIFGSYKDAIDTTMKNTNDPNIRDSMVALERARKNYRTSLERIDAFQERELSKYFGSVDNLSALTSKPDAVLDKIAGLSPNERAVAFDIVRRQLPDGDAVIQSLQARQWEKMIAKAQVKGGSDTAPRFDINKFLGEMDKADQRLLIEMIPDPTQRKAVRDTLDEMRIMARRNDWTLTEKGSKPGTEAIGAVAQATGVRTIVASGLLNIINDIKQGIIGPDRMLNMMLNPNFKGNTIGERLENFTKAVTGVVTPTATDLTRAIRPAIDALGDVPEDQATSPSQPTDESLPEPPKGFFEDELPAPPKGFFSEDTPTPKMGTTEQQTMRVQPSTQRARDDIRRQILEEELRTETDPTARASIERELKGMK